MNPALKPILAAIESAVVRIEYARDDEHAQREAEELLDNARTLLGILNESVPAFTEADPVPAIPVIREVTQLADALGWEEDYDGFNGMASWSDKGTGALRLAWWDPSIPRSAHGWGIFEFPGRFATPLDALRAYTLHLTPPTARNTTLAP